MNEHERIEGLTGSTEHEELVRQVLLGDLAQSDERILRLEAGCPPCSTQLREHAQISAMLDEGGDLEMQSILAEVREADDFPGDDQVDSVLKSLAVEHPLATPGGGRWRFRSIATFAAAAALVLAFVLSDGFMSPNSAPTGATHLGPTQAETQSTNQQAHFGPQGKGADFSRVFWDLEIPLNGLYQVRAYDNTGGTRGTLVVEKELVEPEWLPNQEDIEKLTGAILLEVICYDAAGRRLGQPLSWSAWSDWSDSE